MSAQAIRIGKIQDGEIGTTDAIAKLARVKVKSNDSKFQEILADLDNRVRDKILEPGNAELLKKLINKADSLDEAIRRM